MFNEKEQEIIQFGVDNGKTGQQIKQAVINFRLGRPGQETLAQQAQEVPQVEDVGFLEETKQDIFQIGRDVKSSIGQRASNIADIRQAEEAGQGKIRSGFQAFGQTLGGVGDVIGNVFKGIVKTILPQKAEEAVKTGIGAVAKPIVESDTVKAILERYNSLDPDTKRDLDAVLGIASFGAEVTGGVALARGVKAVGKAGVRAGAKVTGAGAKVSSKPISATGGLLKKAGVKTTGLTVTPKEATVRAMIAYDKTQPTLIGRVKNLLTGKTVSKGRPVITPAETAARKGLWGTEYSLGVKAAKAQDDLWKGIVQPKLQATDVKVNMKDFLDDLSKEINKTAELGRRADMKTALKAFREDFKNVSNITLEKLQKYKEGWALRVPEKTYKGKPIGSPFRETQNMAADNARQIIYKHVGEEGRMAYIDYGNLKSIVDASAKISLDPAKKSVHRVVWQTIMDKAVTPISTIGGLVLYRTGEGLELIGKAGAARVSDIIK